jgi:tRNA(Ile)-lysidine synthase
MDLSTRFTTYLREERLWRPGQRWLLAVSGGLDSVVLTHLCVQAGIEGAIAHCNFQLRGEESLRDEAFVRALADRYERPVYVHHFDTEAYASARKVSIQVAARELRYTWFRTLIAGAGTVDAPGTSAAIATAHHLDDNIETLLMNLVKGTGAAGLRGMLPLQDQVVRPLLFATREDLEAYAAAHGLDHVEDSSNGTDRYNRNFFRHRVIPLLEERYPDVRGNLADNLSRFKELEVLYRQSVNRHREDLLEPSGKGAWKIAVAKLERAEPLRTILFELLKPFGFNAAQAGEAMALLHSTPGRFVASASHRVIRDRRFLLICSPERPDLLQVVLEDGDASVSFPQGVLSVAAGESPEPGADPRIALLDAAHIHFPLLLRRWKPGDYFYPLGMRKKKKLARFFIDGKLSLADKEKVWVLESSGKILWVVGLRIDERFKVTPATKRVLRLEWAPRTDL